VVLLIERSTKFYLSTIEGSHSSSLQHHSFTANFTNDDGTFDYNRENSGLLPNGETKAIVVASTTREDTSWMKEHLSDWNLNIYVVNVCLYTLRLFGTKSTNILHRINKHLSQFLVKLATKLPSS